MNIQHYDRETFRLINGQSTLFPWFDWLMIVLSSNVFWLSVLIVTIVMAYLRRDRQTLGFILVLAVAFALVDPTTAYVLKPWFGRLRPCHALEGVTLSGGGCGGLFGFPSNHAVNAGAVVGVLSGSPVSWRTKILPLAIFLALAVCFSRVWVGVHYPADVIVGLALGLLSGVLVSRLAHRMRQHFHASSGKNNFFP